MLDHRHAGVFGDEADQAFAAARNREIDDVAELQQVEHRLPAQIGHQGQHVGPDALRFDRGPQRVGDRGVGMDRLAAAAQQHAVAGLEAQRRGIGGHVGAGLVDHRDHAQRYAHLAHAQPVRTHVVAGDPAHGIRQLGDVAHGGRDPGQSRGIQAQTVEQRARRTAGVRGFDVARVRGQDDVGLCIQRIGHRAQQGIAGIGVEHGQLRSGIAARQRRGSDLTHGRGCGAGAPT